MLPPTQILVMLMLMLMTIINIIIVIATIIVMVLMVMIMIVTASSVYLPLLGLILQDYLCCQDDQYDGGLDHTSHGFS